MAPSVQRTLNHQGQFVVVENTVVNFYFKNKTKKRKERLVVTCTMYILPLGIFIYCPSLYKMAKHEKTEGTLFFQTVKVEENKCPHF